MSVENGIRHLLNKKAEPMVESIVEATEVSEAYPGMGNNKEETPMAQGSSSTTKPEVLELGSGAGAKVTSAQPLAAGVGPKEDKPMKQGSSQDATIDSTDDQDSQGKTQSAKMKKDTTLPKGKGVGKATNFTDYMDLVSAVSRVGNIMAKEEVEVEVEEELEEEISEEEFNALSDEDKENYELVEAKDKKEDEDDDEDDDDEEDEKNGKSKMSAKKDMFMKKVKESLATDVQTLFASESDLSEDFKTNAASLFEAVVTARVAFEMQEIEEALTEEASNALVELHEELISDVDGYLTHVAEQWLADNEVAVETGLRAKVTEDFISGLKTLFEESYIEIPEEKYNVLGEMQAQNEALVEKVNEVMAEANELKKELEESKREAVFVKVTADLAQTEAEKLHGLVEDVEFENETIFEKKLNVIKTNYFPKSSPTSVVVESDAVITEEVSGTMLKYAEMIGRTSFGK